MAAEPHTMKPWEMDRLCRDEIFAWYLRPKKKKKQRHSPISHRGAFFAHGLVVMKRPWLEVEAAWQVQQVRQRQAS